MADSAKSNRTLFELDLLRALVMVADCGSFTTAATRLHSTQSTVSQKVRRLEALAGIACLNAATAMSIPPMPATPCSAMPGACST